MERSSLPPRMTGSSLERSVWSSAAPELPPSGAPVRVCVCVWGYWGEEIIKKRLWQGTCPLLYELSEIVSFWLAFGLLAISSSGWPMPATYIVTLLLVIKGVPRLIIEQPLVSAPLSSRPVAAYRKGGATPKAESSTSFKWHPVCEVQHVNILVTGNFVF